MEDHQIILIKKVKTKCRVGVGGESKSAHARISFKLWTLFAQGPAVIKMALTFRSKNCGSQESSLMSIRLKGIPVLKPIGTKSTIQHDF